MALGTTSQILLNVKADTKQARRELGKLSKEEQKLAKEFIQTQEKRNAKIDKQIATLGKLALGVGAVVGAYKTLTAAAEFYAKRQQLVTASAGANINAIQSAARGLITQTQALEFAAAAQNTEFKLSQKEMETVAKAMVSLRNQGNDWLDVQRRLTQAVVEGNAEALKPFGVIVEGSTGKLETHKKVMAALTVEAGKLADGVTVAGDAFLQSQVKIQDWVDDVKAGVGEATNEVLELLMNMERALERVLGVSGGTESDIKRLRIERAEMEKLLRDTADAGFDPFGAGDRIKEIDAELKELMSVMDMRRRVIAGSRQQELGVVEQLANEQAALLQGELGVVEALQIEMEYEHLIVEARKQRNREVARTRDLSGVSLYQAGTGSGLGSDAGGGLGGQGIYRSLGAVESSLLPALNQAADAGTSIADTFDRIPASVEAAGVAFSAFSQISQQAFDAWISGNEAASLSFKDFIGSVLRGVASQMFAKSLFYAAEALAHIVPGPMFNPAAAGAAIKTAGAYAGGAAVIGGLARQFGTSGPGAVRGGGLPSAAIGAGGGAPAGGTSSQTFLVVQDQFDDDPRAARRRLRKAFDRAQGEYRGEPAVVRA